MGKKMTFDVSGTGLEKKRGTTLADGRPDLMEIWDWEKNDALGLDPNKLMCGSNKVAWWKCHEHPDGYDMSIGHRCRDGARCPYCSGKRLVVGKNDLESQYPQIAKEWDSSRNGDVTPKDVFKCSNKSYWWLCQEHGSYKMAISNRTSGGSGCPKCKFKNFGIRRATPLEGKSLGDLYPNLAKEWASDLNGALTPYDVKPGSNKKVYWRHGKDHVWPAIVCSRVSGRGCPYCAGRKLLAGFNDLATVAPDMADELHPTLNNGLTPKDIMATSHKKVWWLGKCGHKWPASPKSRVVAHTGCPHCYSGRRVSFSEKSLFFYIEKLFPDAEQNAHPDNDNFNKLELDVWIPSLRTAVEYDGYYWHNKNPQRDAEKDAACSASGIKLIRVRESGCIDYPNATAKIIKKKGYYGYGYQDDAIAEVLCELSPELCGSIDVNVERDRDDIVRLITMREVENSFENTHPEIAAQWHKELNGDMTPRMFTYGSKFRAWWICPNGHEPYQASIGTRTRGCGCPKCKSENIRKAKLTPRPGNSIAEKFPELAKEWSPRNGDLTPYDVSYGSRTYMVWWICPNGHDDYLMLPNGRTSGHGCPECAHEIAVSKLRDAWARKKAPVGTQLQIGFAC